MDRLISLFEIILLSSSPDFGAVPNKISAITIGPIAVPNEFTPPAKFKRLDPLSGSPNDIANGFAAVCCNENPSATMKNAPKT